MNSKPNRLAHVAQLAIAALLAFPAVGAMAQSAPDLSRVEVTGQRPTPLPLFNVRATCPGIDVKLQHKLSAAWFREQESGIVDVQFQLAGNQITSVTTANGPRMYGRDVRRAVRDLDCEGNGAIQTYAFQVQFLSPEEAQRSPNGVALLMLK
ncbi:MAG TPA: hypothetical protein VGE47_11395 [Burkholderiaceae bacterium]